MSGDWIKWTKGLADRREVVMIASRLHRDRHEVAGRLMRLWEWCDDNISEQEIDPETGDAVLNLGDDALSFLDALLGLPGFADAMASPDIRWLTPRSRGRIAFPNLGRHNGKPAKTRAMEAQKKQKQRRDKCPDSAGTKNGLEKRREEKKERAPPSSPPERRTKLKTFDDWESESVTTGVPMVPDDDPIFRWAAEAGIPDDFLDLAWPAFCDRYRGNPKRYADWRAVFRHAVKGNWLRVWFKPPDAPFVLTTVGEQYRRIAARQGATA